MAAGANQVVLWIIFGLILAALFFQSGFSIEDITGAIVNLIWSSFEFVLALVFLVCHMKNKSASWIRFTAVSLVILVGIIFCSSVGKTQYWRSQPNRKHLTEQEQIDGLKNQVDDLQKLQVKQNTVR